MGLSNVIMISYYETFDSELKSNQVEFLHWYQIKWINCRKCFKSKPITFSEGKLRSFSGSLFMVKIEDTMHSTTFVKFTPLISNVNDNFEDFGNNAITRKLENFTSRGSLWENDESNIFETVEFLDRTIKNIKIWN